MIDILMNFRTTYVKEGEVLITSPWKIAVHYLKTYFVVDLVAAIPWDLLASFNSGTEEVSALHAKLSFEFHVECDLAQIFLMSTLAFWLVGQFDVVKCCLSSSCQCYT